MSPQSAPQLPSKPPAKTSGQWRTRPISAGYMRAFEAVARQLNFRAAAEELSLTQSAVSRQIQSLEEEVGASLFHRHTRAVELTSAGATLLRSVLPSLERIDAAVRQIRLTQGRKTVSVTTFASMASMWLIPRLEAFQRAYPEIDIRVSTSEQLVDLDLSEFDLALRYMRRADMPASTTRLFGDSVGPVMSTWLAEQMATRGQALRTPADLAQFTLINDDHDARDSAYWRSWAYWFEQQGVSKVEPPRWLSFDLAHQQIQCALSGQGVALARMPLVADALSRQELIEPFPQSRVPTPYAYWQVMGPRAGEREEVKAFCTWLGEQAALTRRAIGEVPDGDVLTGSLDD
jgi:LysR family transcriptional regulator, glycine cleavage system transcriptional activator